MFRATQKKRFGISSFFDGTQRTMGGLENGAEIKFFLFTGKNFIKTKI
jgi:hypothetical protein